MYIYIIIINYFVIYILSYLEDRKILKTYNKHLIQLNDITMRQATAAAPI